MDHFLKKVFQISVVVLVTLVGPGNLPVNAAMPLEPSPSGIPATHPAALLIHPATHPDVPLIPFPISDWEKLHTQLLEAGYEKLFVSCDESVINAIWNDGKQQEDLEKLLLEQEAQPAAVFLAANLLMTHNWQPKTDEAKVAVAKAFAYALKETKAPQGALEGLTGNVWGLPIEPGTMGPLSEQLISLGDIAIPHLGKALDDITMLPYTGEEETSLADYYIVRVRDVATRIVVRIKGYYWQWASKPIVRDASIGFMREQLGF